MDLKLVEDAPLVEKGLSGDVDAVGSINIWEWRNIGYVAQYFTVGLIYGGLPATMYGVFIVYLNVPAYVYTASATMVTLPWSFKMFFGLLNDCVPIRGLRRKPYMIIGWTMCTLALIALSMQGLPEPYWCRELDGSYITSCAGGDELAGGAAAFACGKSSGHEDDVAQPCNPAAAELGGRYAFLMFLACFGYVVADVAADGLTVMYARREPAATRGYVQTTAYLMRSIGSTCSIILVAFGMNGKEYSGSFTWGLSFPSVCGILSIPSIAMVPLTYFCVMEMPVEDAPNVRTYFSNVWRLMQSGAFFAVILYCMFPGGISPPAGALVMRYWAGVQNLQKQLFGFTGVCLFSIGLVITRKYFLNSSWRFVIAGTNIFLNMVDAVFTFCTIFAVVRNQYFFLGQDVIEEIPSAMLFIVSTFVIVEMADDSNGGLIYGLLSTASNLSGVFSTPLSNEIYGLFRPSLSDAANFIHDTPSFRRVVANSYVLSYAVGTCLTFLLLPLIPNQKKEAQARKLNWPYRRSFAVLSLVLLSFTFLYSVTLTFLTMIPQTACLEIVGGPGC